MQINSTNANSPMAALMQKYQSANGGKGLQISDSVKADFKQMVADRKSGNTTALKADRQKLQTDFASSLKSQGVSSADIQKLQQQMKADHHPHHHHHSGGEGQFNSQQSSAINSYQSMTVVGDIQQQTGQMANLSA